MMHWSLNRVSCITERYKAPPNILKNDRLASLIHHEHLQTNLHYPPIAPNSAPTLHLSSISIMDTQRALPTSPRDKPRPNPVSTIAAVLKTIMAEIASSPNMRAIVRAQTLLDLIAEMQAKVELPQMNQGGPASPLRQAEVVQQYETRIGALEGTVKSHEAAMDSLEAMIKSGLHVVYVDKFPCVGESQLAHPSHSEVNSAARAYNIIITRTKDPFHRLKDERNRYITAFPASGDELNGKTCGCSKADTWG